MAQTKKTDSKLSVRLLCIYSDGAASPGPGETVNVDPAEAARLIGLGAAVAVK